MMDYSDAFMSVVCSLRVYRLFETLIETKEKLLIEMRATDQTVSELQDLLTPEQAGKFLLLSDKVGLS